MEKKRLALFCVIGISFYGNSQTTLLNEGFESYTSFSINTFGSWTTLDLDGLTTRTLGGDPAPPQNWVATWPHAYQSQAYQIFEPAQANVTNDATGATGEIRNFDPHSGSKYAGSWAGEMVQSFEGNKDWLISPSLSLGSSGNVLKFWVKTLSSSYGDERFRVGIYSGTGNPTSSADFTIISPSYSSTEPFQYAYSYWTERTLSLDTYAGQTIKIGFFCMTQQGSMLMIDDVKVTTLGTLSVSKDLELNDSVSVFPNPTSDVVEINSPKNDFKEALIIDSNGKIVLRSRSKTFNIQSLPVGNYLVKIINSDNTNKVKKIIKK